MDWATSFYFYQLCGLVEGLNNFCYYIFTDCHYNNNEVAAFLNLMKESELEMIINTQQAMGSVRSVS